MSKIIFNYGCMSASKSAQLLMQNYNYEQQGLRTLLIKPDIDNRDGVNVISSRIGLSKKSDWNISSKDTSSEITRILENMYYDPDVILVDECQFLGASQVNVIVEYARINEIELHSFGLLKDFQNHLFEGSKAWLELSDSIIEIKTTCHKCTRKATCNLRLNKGIPVTTGETIQIGGDESYVSVCAYHYIDYED